MSLEASKVRESLLTVSASPHIRAKDSIQVIMRNVLLALTPAALFSIYHFGVQALILMVTCMGSAMVAEYAMQRMRNREHTLADGSAALTGLLLAMCLPPALPAWMGGLGAAFAIIIAKHAFGGLGYNIFNPAHIGRAALMASWPVAMTTWSKMTTSVDVVSSATPLNILKLQGYDKLIDTFGSNTEMYKAMLLGFRNGSLGETSTILLILGGIYLIYKGYVYWETPVFMIGTVGLLTWVFGPTGMFTGDPIFHMMAGGLIIGAFFMATDMVTIPITRRGQIIFAVGCGVLTVLIRLKGGYPEGVCYSILLMNVVTPLIDRLVQPTKYGARG